MGLKLWKDVAPKRVKMFAIEADTFLQLVKDLDGKHLITSSGMPADARVVGIRTDYLYNTVELAVESEEFPEVPAEHIPGQLHVDFTWKWRSGG